MNRRLRIAGVLLSAFVLAVSVLVGAPRLASTQGTGAAAHAASVAPAATVVAAARQKARVSAVAVKQRSGRVALTVRSNARYVRVKYTRASGKVTTRKLRVRSSVARVELAAGSRAIRVRALATKRLKRSAWIRVTVTTPKPSPVKPRPTPSPKPTPTPTATGAPGIRVSGNQLVDAAGRTVVLHGVNRSGSEYACIDGWGVFDGPVDQASIDAMKRWGINTVRVPLNSACWLDVREQFASYNAAFAGEAYQDAIAEFVDLLTANDMYTVLDLQWTGCGSSPCLANWLKPMPDRAHATDFWGSVATRFRANGSVLFDLFNEPQNAGWACWRDGGCTAFPDDPNNRFVMEGMQPMVDAVRGAGATTQPILLGGLSYANDMTGWMANLPTDPSWSLVASIHLYNFNAPCPTVVAGRQTAADAITCFTSPQYNSIEEIADAHPVVFGELGQDGCRTDFVDPMLDWIGARGFSVLGWAWNTADCSSFPALVSDYDGTPTTLGTAFQRFFATSATQ